MTVSEQIIQVIDSLCAKFGIVVDWTSNNITPYIEMLCGKLIKYEIATSIFWMVLMVSLSIASIVATKKLIPVFKKGLEECYDDEMWMVGTGFAIVGLVILNLATIIVVGSQIVDIIKCMTFPEMYIFEYVSNLMGLYK